MREFLARYMPPDYSKHGPQLDQLNAYVHWLMLILFVIWALLFVFILLRFNAKRHPKADYHGTTSHLSTWGEVGVFLVEVLLLFGISIPAWSRWTTRPAPETNPLEIRIVAEQFAWNIHYPGPDGVFGRTALEYVSTSNPMGIDPTDPNAQDDIATINQLHLEVNRPAYIRITSKDVIHSFFLPEMRVKQDAIPGMLFPVWFVPTVTTAEMQKRKGDPGFGYEIACAQLCGNSHYSMQGHVTIQTQEEFDAWMAERQEELAADEGVDDIWG
jgi:cytochrome c oxidase subunit II